VRWLPCLLVGLLVLSSPAGAASVDPSTLVLRPSDVPSGFRVDRSQTGVRTNEREARNDPRLPALFRRWGRVTGYEIEFDRAGALINSRADVFRSDRGAAGLLAWFDREVRVQGQPPARRIRVEIGAGGWLYRGKQPEPFALVVFREGRVFGGVAGIRDARKLVVGLARKQQRRIAAALR